MKFRKFTACVLAVIMGLSVLTACGNGGEEVEEKTMDMTFLEYDDTYYNEIENVAMTIYVDCNVESSGDGSEGSPYKTIAEAQAKIAELKASETGLPAGGIRVLIASGRYSPMSLNEANSGTESCPIYYVAEEKYGVVITPSTELNVADFEPLNADEKARFDDPALADKLIKVDLKKYGLTVNDWGRLCVQGVYHMGPWHEEVTGPDHADIYFNGESMTLAKYPNGNDWLYTGTLLDAGTNTKMPNFSELQDYGATFTIPDDLAERSTKWDTLDEVWTYGFFIYNWADASNPIKEIDVANKTLTLAHGTWYGIESEKMYYVFNVFEELDTPGEHYIDRVNGILYMYPTSDLENARISIGSSNATPISVNGASYFTVKGFFCGETKGDIVNIYGSHNMVFDNCKFKGSVHGGFWTVNVKDFTIQNCEISHTGHHAIYVDNREAIKTFEDCNVLITNNYIHHYLLKDSTVGGGLQIYSPYTEISHNEICDATFIGISWDGPYTIIEYNELYNICNTASDAGAINSGRLFTSYGSEVRYNYIHDLYTPCKGGFLIGIYWDDGMSGQSAHGNIVENVQGWGFSVGGGRDHKIYNNIVINVDQYGLYYDSRCRDGQYGGENDWFGKTMDRSVIYSPIKEICSNEYWKEHFPHLSELIITPTEENKDDPMLAINPANSYIANNIMYRDPDNTWGLGDFVCTEYVQKFSEVHDNYVIWGYDDFPAAENSGWYLKENSKLMELLPDFEPIPFDDMGRLK